MGTRHSLTISEIAAALELTAVGDVTLRVGKPCEPAVARAQDLALAMDARFADQIAKGSAQAAIVWADADWQALGLKAAILAPRARMAMAGVTQVFDTGRGLAPGIHPTAIVDPTAELGKNVSVGPYTLIGAGVKIGAGGQIFGHCSIADGTVIGEEAILWEGVRIGHGVRIGDRVRIQYNVTVGADGFSFVTPEAGAIDAFKAGEDHAEADEHSGYSRIHSLGAVVLGDDIEIGAGSAIDRGTIKDTRIGDGTKLDNLVHVGHNVQVGKYCLLCGQVGIAGSASVGDRVVLGGQVGVADHVTIGTDVIVAGKAGVSSNVPANRAMMGSPAIPMENNIAAYKEYRRLPRLVKKVETLQKQVSKLLSND